MKFTNRELETQEAEAKRVWRRLILRRYSAVELLVTIILLFAITPFVQNLRHGRVIESVMMTLLLLSAVLAVAGRRSAFWGILLVTPALAGRWLNHLNPKLFPMAVFHFAALVFIGYVIGHLLRFVLTTSKVNHETLCASIAAYLMIGILWSICYELLAQINPSAFAFSNPGQTMDSFNAFYLSFVTLSTVGYGDVTPVSRGARMLAVMEAITGMFYVAVLVARLVSIYSIPQNIGNKGSSSEQ